MTIKKLDNKLEDFLSKGSKTNEQKKDDKEIFSHLEQVIILRMPKYLVNKIDNARKQTIKKSRNIYIQELIEQALK